MAVCPTKSNGSKKRLIKTNDEVAGGITEAFHALQDGSADDSKTEESLQTDHMKTSAVSVEDEQDKLSRSIWNQSTVSHIVCLLGEDLLLSVGTNDYMHRSSVLEQGGHQGGDGGIDVLGSSNKGIAKDVSSLDITGNSESYTSHSFNSIQMIRLVMQLQEEKKTKKKRTGLFFPSCMIAGNTLPFKYSKLLSNSPDEGKYEANADKLDSHAFLLDQARPFFNDDCDSIMVADMLKNIRCLAIQQEKVKLTVSFYINLV